MFGTCRGPRLLRRVGDVTACGDGCCSCTHTTTITALTVKEVKEKEKSALLGVIMGASVPTSSPGEIDSDHNAVDFCHHCVALVGFDRLVCVTRFQHGGVAAICRFDMCAILMVPYHPHYGHETHNTPPNHANRHKAKGRRL